MKYMLIQWIEDPPTWDVLPVNKITNGHCTIGNICDVSYEQESSPAKILNIGTRSVMMHKLELLERSARATREDEDEPENELGRGIGMGVVNRISGYPKDTYSQDVNNHAKEQEGWKKDPVVRIQSELEELKHLILGLQAQVACLQKSIENKATFPEPCLNATVTCPETDHEPRSRTDVSSDDSPRDIPKVKIGPNTFISPCQ